MMRDGIRGESRSKSGEPLGRGLQNAGVAADRHGVPFDYAQGRLSTSFGWRLSSLRATKLREIQLRCPCEYIPATGTGRDFG
jgi:hypothetical protein